MFKSLDLGLQQCHILFNIHFLSAHSLPRMVVVVVVMCIGDGDPCRGFNGDQSRGMSGRIAVRQHKT